MNCTSPAHNLSIDVPILVCAIRLYLSSRLRPFSPCQGRCPFVFVLAYHSLIDDIVLQILAEINWYINSYQIIAPYSRSLSIYNIINFSSSSLVIVIVIWVRRTPQRAQMPVAHIITYNICMLYSGTPSSYA